MKKLSNQRIVEKSNEIYDEAARKYGVSSRSVLWDNPQTQYFRFFDLIRNLDVHRAKQSILDVGCGNA